MRCTSLLATSRVIHSVRTLCHSLDTRSPVICANGPQIYGSFGGKIWKSFSFPKEVGLQIANLADARGWELSTTVGDTTYYRQRSDQTLGPLSAGRATVARNVDAIIGDPVRIWRLRATLSKTYQLFADPSFRSDAASSFTTGRMVRYAP